MAPLFEYCKTHRSMSKPVIAPPLPSLVPNSFLSRCASAFSRKAPTKGLTYNNLPKGWNARATERKVNSAVILTFSKLNYVRTGGVERQRIRIAAASARRNLRRNEMLRQMTLLSALP